MIVASGKTVQIIMFIFLLCIFIFVAYFLNEVKEIENMYDSILLGIDD